MVVTNPKIHWVYPITPKTKLMCALRYSRTLSSNEFKFIIGDTLDKFCAHAIISIKY